MSVRTLSRLAALTFSLSLLLGASSAFAFDSISESQSATWQVPGYAGGTTSLCGDPDGVQGLPPTATRKSSSDGVVAKSAGSWDREDWRAIWARWFAGLLQRIGHRY
jgi:hypothetical protein